MEAREWLDEEPYELADKYPAARQNRLAWAKLHSRYKNTLFDGKSFHVTDSNEASKKDLERLIIASGGWVSAFKYIYIYCPNINQVQFQVSLTMDDVDVVVGNKRVKGATTVIDEKWLFDSVCQNKVLSVANYVV